VEERMLGRNVAHPGGNAQPRGSFEGGSYRGKGGQITWQAGAPHTGENRGGGRNVFSRGGNQAGPRRDPNIMDVDRGRGGDRMCYHYGKFGHMARNYWEKNRARVVKTPQESAKETGDQ